MLVFLLLTYALGVLARWREHKIELGLFSGLNCESEKGCNSILIGEHECRKREHNFLSYQARNPPGSKHRNAWKQGSCKLHFYLDTKCSGTEVVSEDVLSTLGTCRSSLTQTPAGKIEGVESFRLVCNKTGHGGVGVAANQTTNSTAPDVKTVTVSGGSTVTVSASTSSSVSATTVTVNGPPSSSAHATTVTVSGSGSGSAQVSTVTVTAQSSHTSAQVSTVTVTPTEHHENVLYTAYIKTTTTIIAPPTATVEGTTTVWVRPSSQQSVWTQTRTYVVTAKPSALAERDDAATPEAFAGPVLVNHPVSGVLEARKARDEGAEEPSKTIECFASINGDWILSSCALPTATDAAAI